MSVKLEPFSSRIPSAIKQGASISRLVFHEQAYPLLQESRPETIFRYRDYLHAAHNVVRLARMKDFEALIIKFNISTYGLASIMLNKTVVHPDGQQYTGHHLDYWTRPGLNDIVHRSIAGKLCHMAKSLNDELPCFATLLPGDPTGLRHKLHAVGEPAVLTTPTGQEIIPGHVPVAAQLLVSDRNHLTTA